MRAVAALCLLLAACASGGPLPAPRDPVPEPHLAAADGAPLAVSVWGADEEGGEPRAVILAVHGFGDYGPSTYAPAADYWAGRGIETYAYDQRGFGRNPSFGRWPGAEALVADLLGAARQVRAMHPCLPLVVVGHSMGGGVTLAAAGQGLDADALVLAAPAIWGGERMNPLYRAAAWAAAGVMPEHRFTGKGVVKIQASDNIPLLYALGRDPLYLRPPSARELMGLIRVTDLAAEAAPRVTLPAFLLLGDKDQIVPERAAKTVFARLAGERRVVEYPEGWHLLFRDLQARNVWRDVADYALAAKGPACGAPGS